MVYKSIILKEEIIIKEIISIHYFEYASDYFYPGESHDFWEFLYVDKGEVEVMADDKLLVLAKGDIIFHKPGEFHNVKSNGRIAPNLVVISFYSDSQFMEFFNNKILKISEKEHLLLAKIISEARSAFSSNLGDPCLAQLIRRTDAPTGCEQMIKIYLESMLIQLYRRFTLHESIPLPVKSSKQNVDSALYDRLVHYMSANISRQLTIEQICEDNLIGRSQLQRLFHKKAGIGVINFFTNIKIEASKQMIREQTMNFTQIADSLGYSSIHYFSRQFKQVTGMSPTEYDSSIKIISDGSYRMKV